MNHLAGLLKPPIRFWISSYKIQAHTALWLIIVPWLFVDSGILEFVIQTSFYKRADCSITYKDNMRLLLTHFSCLSHFFQFIVVSLKEGMFNNANVLFRTKFVDGVSTVQRTVAKQNKWCWYISNPFTKWPFLLFSFHVSMLISIVALRWTQVASLLSYQV